jgi:hypothetical protein
MDGDDDDASWLHAADVAAAAAADDYNDVDTGALVSASKYVQPVKRNAQYTFAAKVPCPKYNFADTISLLKFTKAH